MNCFLTEIMQFASGFVPVNLATAANTGDWISLANFDRVAILFHKGVGTAGEDPVITIQQATAAAGTNAKALNVTRVDKKQGADLTAIGQFTVSTSASPATNDTFSTNTWTNSTLAEEQAIVLIHFRAQDLDVNNGFYFIQASIADVGTNSQIGGIMVIPYGARYPQQALPSVLA
jgi:hypothetical protein